MLRYYSSINNESIIKKMSKTGGGEAGSISVYEKPYDIAI